jgi:hypothetical protein
VPWEIIQAVVLGQKITGTTFNLESIIYSFFIFHHVFYNGFPFFFALLPTKKGLAVDRAGS